MDIETVTDNVNIQFTEPLKIEDSLEVESHLEVKSSLEVDVPSEAPPKIPAELVRKKSIVIETITQITFKQIFENLIYQDIKDIDGHIISIKPNIRDYYVYLCKERVNFFTNVDSVLKTIVDNNDVQLKHIPALLNVISIAYNNIKEDKELVKNENPSEIMRLLFRILLMLYININDINSEALFEEIINVINSSIDLINIKPIKMTVPQKVVNLFSNI